LAVPSASSSRNSVAGHRSPRRFSPRAWAIALASVVAVLTPACGQNREPYLAGAAAATLHVTSSAFVEGDPIPAKYTCQGEDLSPPLSWEGLPDGTQSIALICDDPDAPGGTWVHWVLYDLLPVTELSEGIAPTELLPGGGTQGTNDFRRIGYGGPCPPPGGAHRYFFKVYALDTALGLDPGASKSDVERAMEGHILAEGRLMGTYQRQ
jgi:Raf kinase inhibitor-like YbhB/YbcL family protein